MSFPGSDISRVDIVELESLTEDDITIAVIGPTGSGKSRFIQKAWGFDSNLGVGHGLEPFTREVIAYKFMFAASTKRESVILLDTVGLNSTNRLDLEVLDDICKSLRKSAPLIGILYMNSMIPDDPVSGTAVRYMNHFKQLCGEEGLARVFLVTTMWDGEHEESIRMEREADLKQDYWNVMLKYGSSIHRFMNTQQSAWGILGSLVDQWNTSETSWGNRYRSRPRHRPHRSSPLVKSLVSGSKHTYHFGRIACFSALLEVLNSESCREKLCKLRDGEAQMIINYLHLEFSQASHLGYHYDQLSSLLSELTMTTYVFPQSFEVTGIDSMRVKARGGFADVYKGIHSGSGQFVAVKVAKDQKSARDERHLKELATWAYLSHPNILSFYGVLRCSSPSQREAICLVSPWMENGNLHDHCTRLRPREDVRLLLLSDVINGLLYLHERNIVHGDIKGVNILVSQDFRALIADFGVSKIKDFAARTEDVNDSNMSIRWAAPERLQAEGLTKSSDIWSFGCLVYEIMSRRIPYDTCLQDHFVELSLQRQQLPERPKGDHQSDAILEDSVAWRVITYCMPFDPTQRPTCGEVHEYFTGLLEETGLLEGYSNEAKMITATPLIPRKKKSGAEFNFSRIYVLLFSIISCSH